MGRVPDTSKRPYMEELRTDVLFSCFAYGFAPDEYFAFRLEGRTLEERKSFMSDQERYLMVYQMNDVIDMDVFLDKYRTYEKYAKYYKREAICVERQKDKKAFLEFVERHPVFVQKNVALSKGDSVTLVDIRDVGLNPGEYFDSILLEGKHIAEERVIQSDAMARLNSSSVNTVRCMTFLDKGTVQIGPCFLKVGQGDSFVDNAGAGGIVCGINSQTGMVITNGFDEFLSEYSEHPETHVAFYGFQVPEWDEMIDLTKDMAQKSSSVRYIGWDMAHTDKGWVVIEGNGSGQMIIPQIVFQKGFKQEIRNLTGGGYYRVVIEMYYDFLLSAGKMILEGQVIQSKTMSKLNLSSVNTVRCITFLVNGDVEIGPCFLKVGRGGSFVDNGGAGGILVGIDNQTGKLSTSGYDEFLTEYTEHPDTGTVFMGYQLPEWDQMYDVVKELSAKALTVRYIGWDLAHTDQGWVVIEGNCSGQMIGPQIVFQRGFKEDIKNYWKAS